MAIASRARLRVVRRHLDLIFSPLLDTKTVIFRRILPTRQEYLECVRVHVECAVDTLRLLANYRTLCCQVCMHALTIPCPADSKELPSICVKMYIPPDDPKGTTLCDEARAMFPAAIEGHRLTILREDCKYCC